MEDALNFINSISHEGRKKDMLSLKELFDKATKMESKLWKPNIIGYGNYHYKYESGREGDSLIVGFASRSNGICIYLCGCENVLEKITLLGKCTAGKGCIYIKHLADINLNALTEIIKERLTIYSAK